MAHIAKDLLEIGIVIILAICMHRNVNLLSDVDDERMRNFCLSTFPGRNYFSIQSGYGCVQVLQSHRTKEQMSAHKALKHTRFHVTFEALERQNLRRCVWLQQCSYWRSRAIGIL
jgi:hypothetical protein